MSVVRVSPHEVRRIVTEYIKKGFYDSRQRAMLAKPIIGKCLVTGRPVFEGMSVEVVIDEPRQKRQLTH